LPDVASDGAGGAIVVWGDYRSGDHADLYAAHVLATGSLDAAWPGTGLLVCGASGDQGPNPFERESARSIIPDGSGGALMAWGDSRFMAGSQHDIYAAHVLSSGTMDPAWPPNGLGLATSGSNDQCPVIIPSWTDGAIVAWSSQGTMAGDLGPLMNDVYLQRVTMDGQLGPATLSVAPSVAESGLLLAKPVPNPSRWHVSFRFSLPRAGIATLQLFDVSGRRVRDLAPGALGAGEHVVAWDGRNDNGHPVPDGLYFCRLEADGKIRTCRLATAH
jgi:hypothetical protein